MNDIENLIVFLDKRHATHMGVKSLYELGITVKVYLKTYEDGFTLPGSFDFCDKANFPTIYIHQYILQYAPLPIIQYVITHEIAHVIQEVYYKDLLRKEYHKYKWHGPSFNDILKMYGYTNIANVETLYIPQSIELAFNTGNTKDINGRFSLSDWIEEGGSSFPIIFRTK